MTDLVIRNLISKANKNGMAVKDMAKAYDIPERTIRDLLRHERVTGSMQPDTHKCGRHPELTEQGLQRLEKLIEDEPDITLSEMKKRLGLSIGESEICTIVKHKLGFSYKKKRSSPASGTLNRTRRSGKRFKESSTSSP